MIAIFKRGSGFTKVSHVHQPNQVWVFPMPNPVSLFADDTLPTVYWHFDPTKVKTVEGEEMAFYEFNREVRE